MRTCKGECKQSRDDSEFYMNARFKTGYHPYCKQCMREIQLRRYHDGGKAKRQGARVDRVEGTFELYDGPQLEGVFSSISEIADYLGIRKATVTAIVNAEYETVKPVWHKYAIIRLYTPEEYKENLLATSED